MPVAPLDSPPIVATRLHHACRSCKPSAVSQQPTGAIKQRAEDFVVDEIPAYEPSGEGTHLYVRFKKTNLTTDDAVRAFARALTSTAVRLVWPASRTRSASRHNGSVCPPTTRPSTNASVRFRSMASSPRTASPRQQAQDRPSERQPVHDRRARHRPSHKEQVALALERIRIDGVPNAFGSQRFGRDGDTHERARAWLTGNARAPGDPRKRRFEFSALQSAIFNAVLEHRVENGTWNVPLLGDLLKKEDSGGMFVCTDVQTDRERASHGELCPTGPIVGDCMRQPADDALELEQRIVGPLIEGIDLRRARSLGEGTRRPLRLHVTELTHSLFNWSSDEAARSETDAEGCAIWVRFVLPKGAYATTVLSNAFIELVDDRPHEKSGEARRHAKSEEE